MPITLDPWWLSSAYECCRLSLQRETEAVIGLVTHKTRSDAVKKCSLLSPVFDINACNRYFQFSEVLSPDIYIEFTVTQENNVFFNVMLVLL